MSWTKVKMRIPFLGEVTVGEFIACVICYGLAATLGWLMAWPA